MLHVLLLWFELFDLVCALGVVSLICCFVLFVGLWFLVGLFGSCFWLLLWCLLVGLLWWCC